MEAPLSGRQPELIPGKSIRPRVKRQPGLHSRDNTSRDYTQHSDTTQLHRRYGLLSGPT
jgi:hypothetical protein